jgi:hypothetical protein
LKEKNEKPIDLDALDRFCCALSDGGSRTGESHCCQAGHHSVHNFEDDEDPQEARQEVDYQFDHNLDDSAEQVTIVEATNKGAG